MNKFDMMREAVAEARTTLRATDGVADQMADMLRGRLRKVSRYTLAALKRELQQFNASTKEWKD
ncbi:hypothetical protein H0A64_07035 [Alcaligenaceae bacterium]|nr:hypothetical protein [Alcaligenaceae bacterium]